MKASYVVPIEKTVESYRETILSKLAMIGFINEMKIKLMNIRSFGELCFTFRELMVKIN